MRKITILLLNVIFVNTLFANSFKLHLLFTNNIHGAIHEVPARFINPEFSPLLAGGAGAFTYADQLREEAKLKKDFVILTDAGNIFQGSQLGTYDGGSNIIKWMNWMAYDALVPGVRDFDQGVKNLSRLASEANFPFLASNLEGVEGIKDYNIINANGVKIGLIGLITPFISDGLLPEYYEGTTVSDIMKTLNTQIEKIRDEVDLIFVLSHLGIPYDRDEEYNDFIRDIEQGLDRPIRNAIELAHFAKNVDVIITGGVSKGYDKPWIDPTNHTIVLQNYGNLTGIGHLVLHIDKQNKVIENYSLPTERGMMVNLFTDNIWPDQLIQDSIKSWIDSLPRLETLDYSKQIEEIGEVDCGTKNQSTYSSLDIPTLGKEGTLDIMTWNMERFPLKGDSTMQAVAEIIEDLDVDIIGVQEVIKIGDFSKMMSWLSDYDFILSKHSSFLEQAIIYKKNMFTILGQDEPFAMDDYFFAGRPPLVVDFLYHCGDVKQKICIVNMHLKCCGDGLYRRQQSMKQLHGFLTNKIKTGNKNIVVIGDWNDELQDTGIYQSFNSFIDDKINFLFVTEKIVNDPKQQSYPTWPSFLDHILISSGYFDIFQEAGVIRSVNIDEWIGGWSKYENLISDHRPILLSMPLEK